MKKITHKLMVLMLFAFGAEISAQNSIAFIGQAPSYDALVTDADGFTYDDDHAAAVWFMDVFVPAHQDINGSYFSFQDVAEGADISGFDLLWIQADGATWPDRMNEWPRGTEDGGTQHCVLEEVGFQWDNDCSVLQDAFIYDHVRPFYENGGNILLGNFAGKALEVIGVFDGLSNPWEYRPNQTFGDTTVNPANTAAAWGTNWGASDTSPLISGISTYDVTCDFATKGIDFLTADTEKKNRTCQYNLDWGRIYDDAGGAGSTMTERRTVFETTLNAEILLENCTGNEIQGAQFNPLNDGNGLIIWYGAGVYDWYAPGTGNNDNVKLLTENTLLYLIENTLSIASFENPQLKVYPNPTSDYIKIESNGKLNIQVFDLLGKKVYEGSEKTISCSSWSPNLYVVKITDTNSKETTIRKIIKN